MEKTSYDGTDDSVESQEDWKATEEVWTQWGEKKISTDPLASL